MKSTSPATVEEATALVVELVAQGFRLDPLADGRIGVNPGSRLGSDTAERIRCLRTSILVVLKRRSWPCIHCQRFSFVRPTVCYWCRSQPAAQA